MSKKFVLSGYFGFKNFGDEEILSIIVDKLEQKKHKITIITSNPEYTKTLYPNSKTIHTFAIWNIIKSIYTTDYLISGGGSLLQDVTSIKSLYYYLMIIFTALFLRKKVIIFAQGIGPINNNLTRYLTMKVLKHCYYVSVRDKKSHELLNTWGINNDLVCDPIFSKHIKQIPKTKSIVVQLRNFRTMNEDFIDRLSLEINKHFPQYQINILSLQDSIDAEVCEKLQKSLSLLNTENNIKLYTNKTNSQITEIISKAEYLIGMRFHSIIIGILSKCKILPINYDIKVEKIANEFELPIIDLKTPFKNEFEELKNQNSDLTYQKLEKYNFDWTKFENIIK